ncbi:MAG: MotE family protein [Acidobacteriota bacterium]
MIFKRIKLGWLPITIALVLVLVTLKLAITVSNTMSKSRVQIAPAEVMAAGKEKPALDKPPQEAPAVHQEKQQVASKPAGTSVADTIAVLQQREAEIKRKEDQLKEKEDRLNKMEKEVEQKLKDLIGIQKEIQAYRTEKEESQSARVRSLAKIYGTMKAKEAAKLLDNLDDKLVMNIIAIMNSDEAAGILSAMDVKKAAKISEALSGR